MTQQRSLAGATNGATSPRCSRAAGARLTDPRPLPARAERRGTGAGASRGAQAPPPGRSASRAPGRQTHAHTCAAQRSDSSGPLPAADLLDLTPRPHPGDRLHPMMPTDTTGDDRNGEPRKHPHGRPGRRARQTHRGTVADPAPGTGPRCTVGET